MKYVNLQYNDQETVEKNIAEALWAIARELRDLGLGDAYNPNNLGAVEFVGVTVKEGLEEIASLIRRENGCCGCDGGCDSSDEG